MPNTIRRQAFNLVEIILAIVVIGVALLAIVGLVPIGLHANQAAVGNNQAADSADQLIGYYANFLRDDWVNNAQDADLPTAPDDISDFNNYAVLQANTQSAIPGTNIHDVEKSGNDAEYQGIYRITTTTAAGSESAVDFDGIVRVWKTPTTGWSYQGGGTWLDGEDTGFNSRLQLNVEISWPAQKPYFARERAFYTFEVSRVSN